MLLRMATHGLVLTVTCAVLASPVGAQSPTVHIPRVTTPPTLEQLLEASEPEGLKITDLRQRDPEDGAPATQETSAYLSYDDTNLYVLYKCKDTEPGKVRAHFTKREAIGGDDLIGIVLDTFHDRRRAYIFVTNPLGIQLDGITTEGQDDDYSFDTVWYSDGRLTTDGFVVRIAIPFKSLRFPRSPMQMWGIAVGRIIPRNNETAFWPYITRKVEGFAQQLAILEGLEGISPGRNVQLIPYGAFSESRFLDSRTPEFRRDRDARGGLDTKWILKDAWPVDVTINPDFSQVESDEPQVTVNQRYEVFFPEKRPFFLENAGFFQTPENLFFSRRIGAPDIGARLTGKSGGWALGGLVVDDRAPGQTLSETDPLRGRHASIGVARVQREFGAQSTIGVLATTRAFGPSSNQVYAVDARLKLNPVWVLNAQLVTSKTRERDGPSVAGSASQVELRRNTRTMRYDVRYLDRSPTFQSSLGFIPRVDIREASQSVGYNWWVERRRLVRLGPSLFTLANWDRRGRRQDWNIQPGFEAEWKGQTYVYVNRSESFELFKERGFRKGATRTEFGSAWLTWLQIGGSFVQGTAVNYFPASGLDPFLARTMQFRLDLTLKPNSRVQLDQTYLYTRLRTEDAPSLLRTPSEKTILSNQILRTRVNYQFTRSLSLRTILDYRTVNPDETLVRLERDNRLIADVLVTYQVNPWTAVYIGYTDAYANLSIDADASMLRHTSGLALSAGRQVFVKTSYLLRF